jgi:hypothetical protein
MFAGPGRGPILKTAASRSEVMLIESETFYLNNGRFFSTLGPMKKLILLAILACLSASQSGAHPGKTDRQGGHQCYKECEEWKLYYREYHLHDKDGRPVRVEKRPRRKQTRPAVPSLAAPAETAPVVTSITRTVTLYRTVGIEEEDPVLSNPSLYVLLLLLIILLLVRMNRKRERR